MEFSSTEQSILTNFLSVADLGSMFRISSRSTLIRSFLSRSRVLRERFIRDALYIHTPKVIKFQVQHTTATLKYSSATFLTLLSLWNGSATLFDPCSSRQVYFCVMHYSDLPPNQQFLWLCHDRLTADLPTVLYFLGRLIHISAYLLHVPACTFPG